MKRNGVTNGVEKHFHGATDLPKESALAPLVFSDEELKGLAVMCEGSVPTCVYDGVMSAVKKIEGYFGRSIRLTEMNLEWIAKHPPVKDPVVATSAPPKGGPIRVVVRCKAEHTWESTTKGGAPADPKCPTCQHSWIAYAPAAKPSP